jgi:hypothetical protein
LLIGAMKFFRETGCARLSKKFHSWIKQRPNSYCHLKRCGGDGSPQLEEISCRESFFSYCSEFTVQNF